MRKPLLALVLAASASLLLASCAMPADDPNFGKEAIGVDGAPGGGTAVDSSARRGSLDREPLRWFRWV